MKVLLTLAAAASFAPAALAQHAGDVFLTLESGRIVTNSLPGPAAARVFLSEMGELGPHFSEDPGFDSLPGTFPTPGAIGFRIRGPVLRWTGSTFTAIDAPTFSIAFATLGPVSTPACNTVVEGFTINISGGGVCFSSQKPLEPGQILAVEMTLPDFESPVVTLGRVAWCEKGSENFEIGTEFWWIGWGDDDVQQSIGVYIRRALEDD